MTDQLRPTAFFRAFDIAFFVPGSILFFSAFAFHLSPCIEDASQTYRLTRAPSDTPIATPGSKEIETLRQLPFTVRFFDLNEGGFTLLSVSQVAVFLVFVYVLGLICHAIAWPLCSKICDCCELPIYKRHQDNSVWTSDQEHYVRFADYFWYLRSTCWNVAVAIFFGVFLWAISSYPSNMKSIFSVLAVACIVSFLLLNIGAQYGRSYEKQKNLCRKLTGS